MAKKIYTNSFFTFYWDKILGRAWDKFKDNWLTLILASLASAAVSVGAWLVYFLLVLIVGTTNGSGALVLVLTLLFVLGAVFIGVMLLAGWVRLVLNITDHGKAEVADLFSEVRRFFPFLFVTILYTIVVVAGLMLFVVPGIIWGIMFMWAPILVVDKGLGPIEALKKSAAVTDGAKWDLFLYKNLEFGVYYMASMTLVGVILVFPIAVLAKMEMYRHAQR